MLGKKDDGLVGCRDERGSDGVYDENENACVYILIFIFLL